MNCDFAVYWIDHMNHDLISVSYSSMETQKACQLY